jgi:hypothetical protein
VRSDLKEQAERAAASAKPMITIFMKPPGAGAARPATWSHPKGCPGSCSALIVRDFAELGVRRA